MQVDWDIKMGAILSKLSEKITPKICLFKCMMYKKCSQPFTFLSEFLDDMMTWIDCNALHWLIYDRLGRVGIRFTYVLVLVEK